MCDCKTLTELVISRKSEEEKGINFILGSDEEIYVSYKELYYRALEFLHHLQKSGYKQGDEVIFQIEDNQRFVYSFWACILGGMIPVPVTTGTNDEHRLKLFKIWNVLNNPQIIASSDFIAKLEQFAGKNNLNGQMELILKRVVYAEEISGGRTEEIEKYVNIYYPQPEDMAFIQFSSGSTGEPKGVIITHSNVFTNLNSVIKWARISQEDVSLNWMPLTHDMGLIGTHIKDMIADINQYNIQTQLFVRQPSLWMQKASQHKVTLLYSPNFGYKHFLKFYNPEDKRDWELSRVRLIYNGAEPISMELCNEFLDKMAVYGLKRNAMHPVYGLAEGTIAVTFPVPGEEFTFHILNRNHLRLGEKVKDTFKEDKNSVTFIDVGYPIYNCFVCICDDENKDLGEDRIGYIRIRGGNVTSGYYNNRAATVQAISTDGWLNTGDLGFMRNGRLVITGRAKDVIFVSGQNYYSHDIERIAESVDGAELGKIASAGVFNEKLGYDELVLFVLFKQKPENFVATAVNLKRAVSEKLGIEVSQVIPVKSIPKTTSGKVQRYKLREAYTNGEYDMLVRQLRMLMDRDFSSRELIPPCNPVQEKLLEIWAGLLDMKNISIRDNFFALGGDSLKITQLLSRIRDTFHIQLEQADFFENPDIEKLSEIIEINIRENKSGGEKIGKAADCSKAPLSFAQQRLWFLDRLHGESRQYNLFTGLVLKGPLDREAMRAGLNSVIKRHRVLQMSFSEENGLPAQTLNGDAEIDMSYIDLKGVPEQERWEKVSEEAGAEAKKPFDLGKAPLIRGRLLCTGIDEHVLILAVHHIVFDGWSFGILIKELGFYYEKFLNGGKQELPEPETGYMDYSLWQRERLMGGSCQKQLDYWKKQLGGTLPVLELPLDKPRPAVQTYNGEKITSAVPVELLERLKAYAGRENATLFMVLLAAFNTLLYRYTGQPDIILGSPIANRNRRDIEGIIGFFTNNIVLRTVFSGDMEFNRLLEKVKKVALEAYSNQDVPFEKLVEELHVERNMSRNPLFQVLFGFQNVPVPEMGLSDINVSAMDIDGGYSRFDLSLDIRETGGELVLDFEYNTDLFERSTVIRMAGHYKQLLCSVAKNPQISLNKLEMLTGEEKALILKEWNHTEEDYGDIGNWTQLFERQAAETPDSVAAISGNHSISYRELDENANRLAHYLLDCGVGSESILGVYTDRSIFMLAALLGIHKAGAAYLPMDPIFPPERLKYMLDDAGAKIILTQEKLAGTLPENEARIVYLDKEWDGILKLSGEKPEVSVSPHDLAYLIYTSGSTGKPKGVQIEQKALINFLLSMEDKTGISANDTLLAVTTLSFDIAGLELYLPLICGAVTVIASREEAMDGARLAEIIRERAVTMLQATPATWRLITESGWQGAGGLTALCGGEALPVELAGRLLDRCGKVLNVYGPTETTIWSTLDAVEPGMSTVSIGRPIANTQVHVLDEAMNHVPVGIPGELYIGGDGLARGYLKLPQLTEEKFVPDLFGQDKEARLYKTGDLVKYLPDGRLEYIGRIDSQVKIRGFRIELGEIETLLRQEPSIKDCIVADKEIIPGEKSLVAYIIPSGQEENGKPGAEYLREYLKARLPAYMIPSAFVYVTSYPMTPNRKIDRKALPVPERPGAGRERNSTLSGGRAEAVIAGIWQEVLKAGSVDTDGNFFDMGGHSLLMAQVRSKLEKALNREISMLDLFKYPTVRTLAEFLEEGGEKGETKVREASKSIEGRPETETSIAIIGLSGRFPGAPDIDKFWENLCAGVESISRFSDEQVLEAGVDAGTLKKDGYVKAWGALEDIDKFDALFFGYNPREAELLDPQQRIFLEEAWKALENAGYDSQRYGGSIGVYGSVGMNTYAQNLRENYASQGLAADYQIMTGNDKDFLATRVAYKMGLEGPGMTVQTACSSSLVAVHLACQSLLNRECHMALAGGVCVRLPQNSGYLYQEGMILSPDGSCRAFDRQANGTVGGNGAGVVVLKRLQEAVRDGDNISAVIRGSAINNDGSMKIGYTAPRIDGQAKAIAAAQKKAGVEPDTITYIEAHGTGTPLGDPIEIEALAKVFAEKTSEKGFCAIGSVKTNIGHLDAAAGVTGLIKAVLAIRSRKIPPSLHFESPNPKIDFKNSPFYVNASLKDWESSSGPLRAGVSSFGIGGTNAHLILEEAPAAGRSAESGEPCLLIFSAKDKNALDRMTSNFHSFLKQNRNTNIQDAAYTLQLGRREFPCRRYLVCSSVEDALEAFENTDGSQSRLLGNTENPQPSQSRVPVENPEELSLNDLGSRWLDGAHIDWSRLYKGGKRKRTALPAYPFEGQSYWVERNTPAEKGLRTLKPEKRNKISDWFYTPVWKQSVETVPGDAIDKIAFESRDEAVLVLTGRNAFSEALIARLSGQGAVLAVAAGGGEYRASEGNRYGIDFENPQHYEMLLKAITGSGAKLLRIVNLLGVTDTENLLPQEVEQGPGHKLFYSLMYLAQAIGKLPENISVHIKALTNNSRKIFNEEDIRPEKALHLGACRVIPREYPNVTCGSIDITLPQLGGVYETELLDLLIDEIYKLPDQPEEGPVAYRGLERWVQEYEKLELREEKNPAVKLKKNGTYLITGGLGGIGLTIAGFLAGEVQARLVLAGRSEFPEAGRWDDWLMTHGKKDAVSEKILKLRQYQELGAEIFMCRADITQPEQVLKLREQIEREYGTLDGIIHAAGTPGGGMIQLKKKENAESVLTPKVQGTLALYDTFGKAGLDFMLLCSSLNAITGGFGQIDYSGANAFLDIFAQTHDSRKGTRYISIDWDRWPGVGMASGRGQPAEEVHPLLGRCIWKDGEKTVYMNRLNPEKDWVLSEHRIMGIPTIAGTTYLEMARAALEDITGEDKTEISDVVFLNPMAVKTGEEHTVCTVINKRDNNFEFSIASTKTGSQEEARSWQEHARGRLAYGGQGGEDSSGRPYDLQALKEKCSDKVIYRAGEGQAPAEGFISFGGRWRSLVSFTVGYGGGLAEVELERKYVSDTGSLKLHPALLDVAAGTIRLATGGNYLPFSYDGLKIMGSLPAKIYSHISFRDGYEQAADIITCDIDIIDEKGAIPVKITGFSMKKVAGTSNWRAVQVSSQGAGQASYAFLNKALQQAEKGRDSILDQGISQEEGAEALRRIIRGCFRPQIVVSTRDMKVAMEQADYAGQQNVLQAAGKPEAEKERHPRPELETGYAAPRNESEKKLSAIWQEVLGIDRVGIHDEFFALGGDSLLLIQLHSKLKESFPAGIAIVDLYKYNTVALLAGYLAKDGQAGEKPDFENINSRADKQLEFLKRKKQQMQREKGAI